MAFVDTMGTLIGLSARAGFLDEEGRLPQIERPMLVDALTTTLAPILGTTVGAIPAQAYGPALIIVGLFMLSPITRIDFTDYSETVPAFVVVVLMAFTFNIAIGISAGFVVYPICKLVAGKARDLHPGLWMLTALSLLFFIFYPYG